MKTAIFNENLKYLPIFVRLYKTKQYFVHLIVKMTYYI